MSRLCILSFSLKPSYSFFFLFNDFKGKNISTLLMRPAAILKIAFFFHGKTAERGSIFKVHANGFTFLQDKWVKKKNVITKYYVWEIYIRDIDL